MQRSRRFDYNTQSGYYGKNYNSKIDKYSVRATKGSALSYGRDDKKYSIYKTNGNMSSLNGGIKKEEKELRIKEQHKRSTTLNKTKPSKRYYEVSTKRISQPPAEIKKCLITSPVREHGKSFFYETVKNQSKDYNTNHKINSVLPDLSSKNKDNETKNLYLTFTKDGLFLSKVKQNSNSKKVTYEEIEKEIRKYCKKPRYNETKNLYLNFTKDGVLISTVKDSSNIKKATEEKHKQYKKENKEKNRKYREENRKRHMHITKENAVKKYVKRYIKENIKHIEQQSGNIYNPQREKIIKYIEKNIEQIKQYVINQDRNVYKEREENIRNEGQQTTEYIRALIRSPIQVQNTNTHAPTEEEVIKVMEKNTTNMIEFNSKVYRKRTIEIITYMEENITQIKEEIIEKIKEEIIEKITQQIRDEERKKKRKYREENRQKIRKEQQKQKKNTRGDDNKCKKDSSYIGIIEYSISTNNGVPVITSKYTNTSVYNVFRKIFGTPRPRGYGDDTHYTYDTNSNVTSTQADSD